MEQTQNPHKWEPQTKQRINLERTDYKALLQTPVIVQLRTL